MSIEPFDSIHTKVSRQNLHWRRSISKFDRIFISDIKLGHLGMSQSSVLIIFLCLFFHVKAQDKSNSGKDILHPLHPNLAVVIGVLSISFSIVFLLLAYAKFCHVNLFDIMEQNVHNQNFQELIRSTSRFSGVDRAAIESLPFFRFASLKGSKEGLECAVCISRFEETEILRLLPKCRHAFHINCIDKWLERHSSCPLCRYKFNIEDLGSFTHSNSLRFLGNPSNLTEDPNLELVVQRQQDRPSSSRFNIGSNFPTIEKELLIQEGNGSTADRKLFHKFKHKIIVSDVVIKNRWSDVNSSDLLFLNSEMLGLMSSNRFSRSNSTSGRFHTGFSINDNLVKIKEDIEKKRLYESKFSGIHRSHSVSSSSFCSTSYNEANSSNALEKRSKSEITNFSRFRDFSIRHKIKEAALGLNGGEEERKRRLWLPIVRRTVQWFVGQERNSQQSETDRQSLNV
ncbi:hypothetical protein Dsin_017683 [Dipteronia sinensis]|uniref:RING-type E3 ubiquitin transferase n=1 Tax=Dipteronia sinensis TaxID=43782 RepID=A0AAE0E6Y6_9ROSI|nr:hypothetical protein Dsin_017683 [Dipteronia sinensis]